jgi:multisubunit Na+/H+ antiporter MnhG subunit
MRGRLRLAASTCFGCLSAYLLASGNVAAGAAAAVFVALGLLPPFLRRLSDEPKLSTALTATAWCLLALTLCVLQLGGYWLQENVGRGVIAAIACIIFAGVAIDVLFRADGRRARQALQRLEDEARQERIRSLLP